LESAIRGRRESRPAAARPTAGQGRETGPGAAELAAAPVRAGRPAAARAAEGAARWPAAGRPAGRPAESSDGTRAALDDLPREDKVAELKADDFPFLIAGADLGLDVVQEPPATPGHGAPTGPTREGRTFALAGRSPSLRLADGSRPVPLDPRARLVRAGFPGCDGRGDSALQRQRRKQR
jgi:hypothetical protein